MKTITIGEVLNIIDAEYNNRDAVFEVGFFVSQGKEMGVYRQIKAKKRSGLGKSSSKTRAVPNMKQNRLLSIIDTEKNQKKTIKIILIVYFNGQSVIH
jgi:nucleoside 2-deoxyribosyltransferase